MFPSACSSFVIFYIVQLCVAFHRQRLRNGICNLKGGLCLPSSSSTCNPLDAKCDEGNICCKESTAVPIKEMTAEPVTKQIAATCSTQTQDFNSNSGSISVWSKIDYENYLDCEWQITVDAGNVILIEWVKFDIEFHPQCGYDFVEILGQKFCGDDMPENITSSSNQVLVKFHSDCMISAKGFSLTYSSVSTTQGCGIVNRKTRIVGGEETLLHEYPWHAGIVTYGRNRPWCGGSIISSRWILTAAHCLNSMPTTNMQVVVGEHDWFTSDETTFTMRVDIEEVVMHAKYNEPLASNDVGLIKLKTELTFTKANRVAPICLPLEGTQDLFENVDVNVSGWGLMSSKGKQPYVLHDVTVPTMNNMKCQQDYLKINITDVILCTGQPDGIKNSFKGDSGGPVIMEANGGRMVQIGIVTGGRCIGNAAINARVTKFIPWILEHVNEVSFYPTVAE